MSVIGFNYRLKAGDNQRIPKVEALKLITGDVYNVDMAVQAEALARNLFTHDCSCVRFLETSDATMRTCWPFHRLERSLTGDEQ